MIFLFAYTSMEVTTYFYRSFHERKTEGQIYFHGSTWKIPLLVEVESFYFHQFPPTEASTLRWRLPWTSASVHRLPLLPPGSMVSTASIEINVEKIFYMLTWKLFYFRLKIVNLPGSKCVTHLHGRRVAWWGACWWDQGSRWVSGGSGGGLTSPMYLVSESRVPSRILPGSDQGTAGFYCRGSISNFRGIWSSMEVKYESYFHGSHILLSQRRILLLWKLQWKYSQKPSTVGESPNR